MQQTYLILTDTYLDKVKLRQFLSYQFFLDEKLNFNSLPKKNINWNEFQETFEHYKNLGQILEPVFNQKKDFKDQLLSFFQVYNKPTLLFLGDLTQYSLAMQEGMLLFLEEPPKNLFLVLTAQNKKQVLPTILSRSKVSKLNRELVFELLDQALNQEIKLKFPSSMDFSQALIQNKAKLELDHKKIEREEIDLWLWQLEAYLVEFFKKRPAKILAENIQKVLYAKTLNSENVQKRLVLESLV